MFITAGITSLCEQELKIVRAAKTCYACRTLPTPGLNHPNQCLTGNLDVQSKSDYFVIGCFCPQSV